MNVATIETGCIRIYNEEAVTIESGDILIFFSISYTMKPDENVGFISAAEESGAYSAVFDELSWL